MTDEKIATDMYGHVTRGEYDFMRAANVTPAEHTNIADVFRRDAEATIAWVKAHLTEAGNYREPDRMPTGLHNDKTLHYADDVHSTCGTCGRTWTIPTPAARCPFEYDHPEPPEEPDTSNRFELATAANWEWQERELLIRLMGWVLDNGGSLAVDKSKNDEWIVVATAGQEADDSDMAAAQAVGLHETRAGALLMACEEAGV